MKNFENVIPSSKAVRKGKKTSILQKIKKWFPSIITGVISTLVGSVIVELFKPYVKIYGWFIQRQLNIHLFFIIAIIIALFIVVALFLYKGNKKSKIRKFITPIIVFFFGTILLLNSIQINNIYQNTIKQNSKDIIFHREINFANLRSQSTMEIPINKAYQKLSLEIKYEEGNTTLYPEIELEKLSPRIEERRIIIEEWSSEKLIISGLEKAKSNEYFYYFQNGIFALLDSQLQDANLDETNKLRINVRNYAELKETITITLWGN